jgi:hypothetical protein
VDGVAPESEPHDCEGSSVHLSARTRRNERLQPLAEAMQAHASILPLPVTLAPS